MPVRKIKEKLLRKKITGEQKRNIRNKKLLPWDEIRTIGILYQVPEEADYVKFTDYVSRLHADRKEVMTLGMTPTKEVPHYCYPKLYFSYFSRKEVNWMGKTSGTALNDFIPREFDLLINLDQTGNQVFDCIAGLSRARLKTGVYKQEFSMVYDLMISTDKTLGNDELLDEVRRWIHSLCPAKSGH